MCYYLLFQAAVAVECLDGLDDLDNLKVLLLLQIRQNALVNHVAQHHKVQRKRIQALLLVECLRCSLVPELDAEADLAKSPVQLAVGHEQVRVKEFQVFVNQQVNRKDH